MKNVRSKLHHDPPIQNPISLDFNPVSDEVPRHLLQFRESKECIEARSADWTILEQGLFLSTQEKSAFVTAKLETVVAFEAASAAMRSNQSERSKISFEDCALFFRHCLMVKFAEVSWQ